MENLSIEIGNRNIKTNKGIVFPSRYTMFNQIGTEVIQYKGVNYFIGNGEYDIELEKSKKDFMPLLVFIFLLPISIDKFSILFLLFDFLLYSMYKCLI